MRTQVIALAAVLGSCAVPPEPAYAPRQAAEIVGRVPGTPQHCVPIERDQSLHVSATDPGTLIYGHGRTIWANRIAPCTLRSNDVLVMQPLGGSYCKGDIVRTFDSASRLPGSTCILGDFIPFRS
jgi:hypothetical protein